GYEQLAIVEFIVSGSNPPFLVKFGGEEGIVESSGGSIIIETECRESYISGQQNHLLNVFDNFDCAYIDRNIEINCCRIGSNIEAVSYAVGEEENLACSSSLGILRFYNFNGIFPIKLTTQLISDFITPSIDFYQESIINQQYTNQQGEYFELQVPFAGIYRVEYEDECGNISIDYINTCQACDYDIIDDNYYLFGGGLVFDPQCFCDDDCGIGRGAEINISIDENFLYGDNLPVVIEWPMGSNTIIDENGIGGQHPYDLSDHYDNEEEYPESISITISRPDGCVIPLEFEYQNRTEVPYLRSSSNLHYDLFDCSYFASMICNDCFTIEGNNYITDYNDCEGVTAQINFEFIPNPNADQNNPCNDGGSFLIHSYNENGDFIKSQELNIGENLAIAHQSDPRAADIIFTDGNKKCNNGGVCYFDAMDILGIQLDCPLFLPYCFENEDRTDSTDDDDDDPDEGDNDSDCFEDFDYFNANRDPIGDITRVIGDVTEGTKVRTSFDIGAGLLITLELDGIVIWEKGCGKDSNSNITIENDGNLIFYSRHLCQGHGSKLIGEIWCEEGLKEKVATLFKLHQTTMILNLFLLQNCFYKITYQQ
ncbi:MAG: hypothetical protein KJN84_15715, partial [Bacteroidia bacterium]|nr:hypothetical protein [Bacteroidia bacterium]